MKPTRIGCLSGTGIISALITLLIISGVALARGGVLFSPGDLSAVQKGQPLGGVYTHAETGGRCAACHAAFWEQVSMSDRCLACHNNLIQLGQDFHVVMLAQSKGLQCKHCHTEHGGAQVSLTTLQMERFPHNDTAGFSLHAHQQYPDGTVFQCVDCHGIDFAIFKLGRCLECHLEIEAAQIELHLADFGSDCLACHDGLETYGDHFDHNLTAFPLVGEHVATPCSGCHAGARSLGDLEATRHECAFCHNHNDPHAGEFGRECDLCHNPQDWEEIAFDHQQTAFPLLGKHVQVACQGCHQSAALQDTPTTCIECHAPIDPHDGQFGQDCAACHTVEGWENATFDHSLAVFPLTGAHTSVACTDCHLNNIYQGTPQACQTCHVQDDIHGGQFLQDCAACHVTETWEQVNFDHSLAAFQLSGAHASVECSQCHLDGQFIGVSQQCEACHADPQFHQGLFSLNCVNCHNTLAWVPATFNQGHRFPINHGGRASSCRTCHPGTLRAYTCYGCHDHNQNNIERKHREEGIGNFNNCVRCHPTGREDGEGGNGGGGDDD